MVSITAVVTLKNEAAFLLDWLAHHFAVGVTHVVALTNDCEDGTDLMLDHLAQSGRVTHIRNPGPYDKAGIQFTGLKLANACEAVQTADWLLTLDIDEFVNVHTGNHTLPDLIQALPEATAITLTWRLFGNAGIVNYRDQPIPQQFTRAAPEILYWPWRASMFKTLYKNDGTYRKLGVHRPRSPDEAKLGAARWFDCAARELDAPFRKNRIFSPFGRANHKLAQLNHYPLGAMESYLLKADRGRAVHSDQVLGMDYWVERNFNTVEDKTIENTPEVSKHRASFRSDPTLSNLHEGSTIWRHERLNTLLSHEPYRALLGRLLMTPPSRPLPPHAARMLIDHAKSAEVR